MNSQNENIISRKAVYNKPIQGIGTFCLYQFDLENDSAYIHDWVNRDYAKYWDMQNTSLQQVKDAYLEIINGHTEVFMGYLNGEPAFMLEKYNPAKDLIGNYYNVEPGDRGMHILIAPASNPLPNFTWHVFTTIMDFIFSDKNAQRIVVEPDIRNEKIHVLNKKAGFEYQHPVELPHKTAHLAFCIRNNYEMAIKKAQNEASKAVQFTKMNNNPGHAVSHLSAEKWQKANRLLIRKGIAEFTHELIFKPELITQEGVQGHYALKSDKADTIYYFKAQKLHLDHWSIDEASIEKKVNNESHELDGLAFILDFKDTLGIPAEMLPTYLEEITSTLYGCAYMHSKNTLSSNELLEADYQAIEHAMTAGHPCFVANNGRIGFDANDYKVYAPEADQPFKLVWLAGHKSRANYAGVEGLSYKQLITKELGADVVDQFNAKLTDMGVDANDYFFIPVHPWQWFNKLAGVFSPDIANKQLIFLGVGEEEYLAQQSIRTLFNITSPSKFYVKTALSILNMGFMRGLSPYYMGGTPAITEWVEETLGTDEYLKSQGFEMLGEVATMGYRNLYFEELGRTSAYNKMLAALWRESPVNKLAKGQKLMTMAALLHIDSDGNSLVAELIKASGLSVEQWLEAYLKAYLKPLLHCFYYYDIVFMPHGENLILILEDNVPVKGIMKDITEEMLVISEGATLPEEVKRIHAPTPDDVKLLSIFTDVFDCFFRFLSTILVEQNICEEDVFWKAVAKSIHQYQAEWPELASKFEAYDIFADDFTRSCLNRLQLKNNKQMVNLADPVGALQFFGKLDNPIAQFRHQTSEETTLI